VPAFGDEWYPRNMNLLGDAAFLASRGPVRSASKVRLQGLHPPGSGGKFNPDEWAGLFPKGGAKYIVPVAEHHDRFATYDSTLTEWSAA
jgi:alpha-L-fucosidase